HGNSSAGARALQSLSRDLVAWKAYCLAVRTRQVNLQVRDSTTSFMFRSMRLCMLRLFMLRIRSTMSEINDSMMQMMIWLYRSLLCVAKAVVAIR
uniref:Uncharacterized protein n=1 Tax=Cucumis melo TaxID=3656 RepID=A0A9I9EK84_CUCME